MAPAQYQLLSHRRHKSTNSSLEVLIAVLLRIQVFHDEKTCRWASGYRYEEANF